MVSNRDIGRLFAVYAELLLLHDKDKHLSALLSGAAYRIRRMTEEVAESNKTELLKAFKPAICRLVDELQTTGTIEALDELIQLTPAGLFEMMRIRGLGGKKLSVLWNRAGIDSMNALLNACKNDIVKNIPGFGIKSQENIIKTIED